MTAGKNKYKAQAVAKETAILDCTYSVLVHDKNDIGGTVCTVLSENSLERKFNRRPANVKDCKDYYSYTL